MKLQGKTHSSSMPSNGLLNVRYPGKYVIGHLVKDTKQSSAFCPTEWEMFTHHHNIVPHKQLQDAKHGIQ